MTLKVITLNANGIRSAERKGFFNWLHQQNADVVCVQETKSQLEQLAPEIFCPAGFHCYYNDAEKKGYSGVALFSKKEPLKIEKKLGWDCPNTEGRYLQADFEDYSVVSLYLPSGTSGEHRQIIKYDFMAQYMQVLQKILQEKRSFIICGDWNIAHKEIDLKNWKANQNYTGFLPEERAWLDELFYKVGFIDAFRAVNQQPDQYTWWSSRSRTARANNVGWRIDYQIVTPDLKDKIISAEIYTQQIFSDHAPLIMEYKLK